MRADDTVRAIVSIKVVRITGGAQESVTLERTIAHFLPGQVDERKLFDGIGQVLAPDFEGACRFHAEATPRIGGGA